MVGLEIRISLNESERLLARSRLKDEHGQKVSWRAPLASVHRVKQGVPECSARVDEPDVVRAKRGCGEWVGFCIGEVDTDVVA